MDVTTPYLSFSIHLLACPIPSQLYVITRPYARAKSYTNKHVDE
ncbi:hypothetical protein COLO4_11944 [Corchorus olitorius]|uniref:Uncharacterized protein n=1 Tax=Corchorus olitorius TaxID=93759 RepID=A0A1R3K2N9_9ROSI|nr:hypothetical protein COLO4_11944 [Corchorus olitorius]